MSRLTDYVYRHSPVWLQNVGVSVYGYFWRRRRFGGDFRSQVAAFDDREALSADGWHVYQTRQLRSLLAEASVHVPYYRDTLGSSTSRDWPEFGLENLAELPLLGKEAVRATPDAFVAGNVRPRSLSTYHTSGTTGTPLAVKFTTRMHRHWSAAYEARVRHWAGVNWQMSRAMIGGRLVVPEGELEPPFWRYNSAERQLYMSAFHIAPQTAADYVAALNHYQPDYLVGYASSHYFLARMIKEQGLDVIQPKAVLTSSEKLTEEMRRVIGEAYHCQVYDAYSGVEACCLASECEEHRLHLSPDVGVVELINDVGGVAGPGEVGEIVATGLLNFEQPLIRYRTGDYAVLSQEPCPCGRQMPVLEDLVGRLEDTVVGPDGREMVRFHGIFTGLPNVREGQVIQQSLREILVRLVAVPGFGEPECQLIRNRFADRLGSVTVSFEYVDRIERTHRGKYRAVISQVPRRGVNSDEPTAD